MKTYEGALHMLFHEPNRDEVVSDVCTWVLQQSGTRPDGCSPWRPRGAMRPRVADPEPDQPPDALREGSELAELDMPVPQRVMAHAAPDCDAVACAAPVELSA